MQGPGDEYRADQPGRRAGDQPDNADQVRDWQRNTWIGPVPSDMNPFDEPETAPELKASRSRNVNEHTGEFWSPLSDTYPAYGTRKAPEKKANGSGGHKSQKRGSGKRRTVLITVILLLAAVAAVLRFAVFAVHEIQVTGNSQVPAGEIIRISGIRNGDNILFLDEKTIEQRIASDYRLQFRYLVRKLPDKVQIAVREREPCCWLTYCGILYVMDKNRMVLYETEDPSVRPAGLVEVKGLDIRSNTIVGQEMILGNETQQAIFSELFLEMKVLSCTGEIAEADISNPESILLGTRDGYTVSLGNRENIHAKLRSMLMVREELKQMEMAGGTISVNDPETPIYTP